MKGNGRIENKMVKVHTLGLMEESMLGNSRMGNYTVKEPTLILMGGSM